AREVHAWGVQNFTDRHDRKICASGGDHAGCVLAAWRSLDVDLFRDAEPRKKIVRKPDTARAPGDRDGFGLEQDLFEGLDGARVGLWSSRPHRHAEGYSRKIDIRSGGDPLRCDQLTEALPRENHHVGRHAAGELRGNRLRPCSLRRTRSCGDLDPARPLEFRQQLLVRATESAGYQNVQLCRCRHWPKQPGKDDEWENFHNWLLAGPLSCFRRSYSTLRPAARSLHCSNSDLVPITDIRDCSIAAFACCENSYRCGCGARATRACSRTAATASA